MNEVTSREKVLKGIRDALTTTQKAPFDEVSRDIEFFRKDQDEMAEIRFAEEFKAVNGKFVYCASHEEFCKQLSYVMKSFSLRELLCEDKSLANILDKHNISYVSETKKSFDVDCSLTGCEYLISRTGTIMISAEDSNSRSVYFSSPYHFVMAYTSQIVDDISDALKAIKSRSDSIHRFISFITGPSRTADIEKTLVMGAHGPKELFLFLIDDLT